MKTIKLHNTKIKKPDGTWLETESFGIGGGGGNDDRLFIAHFEIADEETLELTTTTGFEEIVAAVAAGKLVFANLEGLALPFSYMEGDGSHRSLRFEKTQIDAYSDEESANALTSQLYIKYADTGNAYYGYAEVDLATRLDTYWLSSELQQTKIDMNNSLNDCYDYIDGKIEDALGEIENGYY